MAILRKQNYTLHAHRSIIVLEGTQFHLTEVACIVKCITNGWLE